MDRLMFFNRLIFFFVCFFFSVSITAQKKRALVIGLGEQEDWHWAKINGDKDVPYVKDMLISAGYRDICTLVNKQATKSGIVNAFHKLARKCKADDIVYIHFSGHGQQVSDVNGDETDGWDESWIPYDAYLSYGKNDKGEKHLIDDEINTLLAGIRNKIGDNGRLLVVVDACHSGESTWSINFGSELDSKEDTSNVELNIGTIRGVKDKFLIPIKGKIKTEKVAERWITLSACKDFQLNQELRSPQVGKLTYTLYSLAKRGNVTIDAIEEFMSRYRSPLPQTPMLTGEIEKYTISDFF